MSAELCPPLATRVETAVLPSPTLRWSSPTQWTALTEPLAVEAPLTIEIAYARHASEVRQRVAITMRTPGHDAELALGFLRAEGLVGERDDVIDWVPTGDLPDESAGAAHAAAGAAPPVVPALRVRLRQPPREDIRRVSRGVLTSSACGLCGRSSLEGLPIPRVPVRPDAARFDCGRLAKLPDRLRACQSGFAHTGGSHAAALFAGDAQLLVVREDVGRHNAVDKVFGAAWLQALDCTGGVLVLSGRASFELVQKAAVAGVPVVLAIGAPSSAAVALADAAGLTLIGFARGARFNVYTHAARLSMAASTSPAAGEPGAPPCPPSSRPAGVGGSAPASQL